ncbi:MAG: hypothetical protein ACI4JB_07080 [Porcipelethomonas sp.]
MTDMQMKKAAVLNRLYYMEMKLSALFSLRESDRKLAEKFISMFPDGDDREMLDRCVEEAQSHYKKTSEQYLRLLSEYGRLRQQTEGIISTAGNPEYVLILTARYIEHKTWDAIAEENFFGIRTVKYKHLKALDAISIDGIEK